MNDQQANVSLQAELNPLENILYRIREKYLKEKLDQIKGYDSPVAPYRCEENNIKYKFLKSSDGFTCTYVDYEKENDYPNTIVRTLNHQDKWRNVEVAKFSNDLKNYRVLIFVGFPIISKEYENHLFSCIDSKYESFNFNKVKIRLAEVPKETIILEFNQLLETAGISK